MVHLHVYLTRTCASGMLALMADSTSTLGVKSLIRETPVEADQGPPSACQHEEEELTVCTVPLEQPT